MLFIIKHNKYNLYIYINNILKIIYYMYNIYILIFLSKNCVYAKDDYFYLQNV